MMVDHRQNHLESIRALFSTVIYPIQIVVDAPTSAGHWVGDKLSSRETLLQENTRLKQERFLLRAQLQKLSALTVENSRLRELLQSSRKVGEHVLIGELLAVDLEPFTRQVVLNKGSTDDVYLGQPLLDADGVMGQIVHVGPFSSTAMLITDPNHAIPVHVNRNGQRAIVIGTGKPDILEVPFLANSTDIVEGDLLISSGLGGRFPPDYPVAKVTRVEKDPAKPYAKITAAPTAQLERSREVLLVWRTQEGAPKASAPLEINPEDLEQAEIEAREEIERQKRAAKEKAAQEKFAAQHPPQLEHNENTLVEPNGDATGSSASSSRGSAPAVSKPSAIVVTKPKHIEKTTTTSADTDPAKPPSAALKKTNKKEADVEATVADESPSMPIQEKFIAPTSPSDNEDTEASDFNVEESGIGTATTDREQ